MIDIKFRVKLISHLAAYPLPPTNLRVTEYSSESLSVSWDDTDSTDGLPVTYTLTYCTSEFTEKCTTIRGIEKRDFTLTGLESFTWYTVTVQAKNEIGSSEGDPSITVSTARKFLCIHFWTIYWWFGYVYISAATTPILRLEG